MPMPDKPSRASDTPTMPVASRLKPTPSNGRGGCASDLGIQRQAAQMPTTPTGTLIQKIQCQEAYSTSQPPRAGPSSGPTCPGMAMKLMARMKASRG